LGGTSGQHDARLLPDGSVSLFDNGTHGLGPRRPPRALRCVIDTQAKTATFAGALDDSEVGSSGCCGCARLLPGGDIVMGWGGTPQIDEYAPDGTRLFRISGTFVYRGTPLLPGQFTAQQFRDGMDAQFAAGLTWRGVCALAAGIVALVAAVALLGGVTEDVTQHNGLASSDATHLRLFTDHRPDLVINAARIVTDLGGVFVLVLIAVAAGLLL